MDHDSITTPHAYLKEHVDLIQGLWRAWFGPVGQRRVTFSEDTLSMTAAFPYPVVKHEIDMRAVGPFACFLMVTTSREINLMEYRGKQQPDLVGELFVVTHMQVKVQQDFWNYACQAGLGNAESEWPFPEPEELEQFFWLEKPGRA